MDIWAPWCSYCRKIGPAYEKIGEEYADSLAVGKINIAEHPEQPADSEAQTAAEPTAKVLNSDAMLS